MENNCYHVYDIKNSKLCHFHTSIHSINQSTHLNYYYIICCVITFKCIHHYFFFFIKYLVKTIIINLPTIIKINHKLLSNYSKNVYFKKRIFVQMYNIIYINWKKSRVYKIGIIYSIFFKSSFDFRP